MGQERGLMHLLHSVVIGVVLYLALVYGVKWSAGKSENMSGLVGGLAFNFAILLPSWRPSASCSHALMPES